jgi:uncharacterized membrane protein
MMMSNQTTTVSHVPYITKPNLDKSVSWISQLWIFVIGSLFGVYVFLPFLAPVLMHIGWSWLGKAIYFIYSFLCHQLPQRSYFLFGPKFSYSLPEIQSVWQNTNNGLILRKFIGNSQMGWKTAWSDRMIAMFTSMWIFSLIWGILKTRIKPLPLWGLILWLLPIAIDGTTHFVSDLSGIGLGFRDSNLWLATLTRSAFPPTFYNGDAWGSFNSLMRLGSGILFGLGLVWFGFPYLESAFSSSAALLENKEG